MSPEPLTFTDTQLAGLLRVPGPRDHKYTRGVLGVWAGSQAYPGAAVLACAAAVRAGVGLVRLQAPQRVADLVLARRPEVVPASGRSQALLIGPGTSPQDAARAAETDAALALALGDRYRPPLPAVLDAGALPLLARRLREGACCCSWHVLTPHAGEAATMLSDLGRATSRQQVEEEPEAAARALSTMSGATVLLKGSPTLVASEEGGLLARLEPGAAWLATAGSGDVLAGVLGALLAVEAASWEGPDHEVRSVGATDVAGRGPQTVSGTGTDGTLPVPDAVAADGTQGAGRPLPARRSAESAPERYRAATRRGAVAVTGQDSEEPGGARMPAVGGGQAHPLLLAALGARIHARAADRCSGAGLGRLGHPVAALDLVETLPTVLEAMLGAVQESVP